MPRLDLDAYVAERSIDPFEITWKGETYTVGEPPWFALQTYAEKMQSGGISEKELRGFLSAFFGETQWKKLKKDGLEESSTAMFKLFTACGIWAMENLPEEMADPKLMKALEEAQAPNSASASTSAPSTSASSKQSSNGTSG